MRIERPDPSDASDVVDMWVDLARGQRAHGSHLCAESNRTPALDAVRSYLVSDGLRVAYDPDPIGFVMYALETGSYEQDVSRGVVRNIYVRPERRGEGVGSSLLDAAEAALRDGGAEVISLESMVDNDAARGFYRRRGYEPHRVELEKRVESDTRERE